MARQLRIEYAVKSEQGLTYLFFYKPSADALNTLYRWVQSAAPGVTDQHWGAIRDTVRRFLEFPDEAGNVGGAARVTETFTGFNVTRDSTLQQVRLLFPNLTLPANLDQIADENLTVDQVDFKRLPNELGHRPGTYRIVPTTHGAQLLMSPWSP